jgi:CPA1 family monovalent cation:H+ antiporter
LPPLIYESGATTPLHGLRANGWAIGALAFGLVIATAAGVTAVAHATVPGLAGPAAFVLGAIIAPADIVVAEAVAERLSVPRRIMILVEGEGLFNDATALVLFRMAVSAALVGRSRSSRPACSLCWPRWAGPPSATSWGGSRCERGGSSTTPWST